MRKPNFFIVGAPKCGTTSLATWLGQHPEIFMSSAKEPHFFNTDDKRTVETVEHYERFFENASPVHRAVGEASVWYLSSSQAASQILGYAPDARLIVMFRNPIEMAPALHAEMLYTGIENVKDFIEAWHLQEERRRGRRLPAFCWVPRRLYYGEVCSLGAQLDRLLSKIPARQILTIVLDDVQRDARQEYLRVLEFLGVADDGRMEFPVYNAAKIRRWAFLPRLTNVILDVKRQLGIRGGLGLWTLIDSANQMGRRRNSLPPEFVAELKRYFKEDVVRLGQLLRRDLNVWVT